MEWFQRSPEPLNGYKDILNRYGFKDTWNGFKDLLNHYDFKDLLNHGMISKISGTMEWFQRSPEPLNGFKDILNRYGFKDIFETIRVQDIFETITKIS